MKKLFIGLLVIAAGAGVFYFLQSKKASTENNNQQKLLTAHWKLDSVSIYPESSSPGFGAMLTGIGDSIPHTYDFRENGSIFESHSRSEVVDTSYYEWSKENELLFKKASKDSTGEVYTVVKLSSDSLVLQSKDSLKLLLSKAK